MDIGEFARIVNRMRRAQRAYFANRNNQTLREAMRLEAKVDEILPRLLDATPLFDREDARGGR